MTSKQSDTLFAKSPLLQYLSTWFFEFEHNSKLELSSFALDLFNLGTESRENAPDISLLLHVYNSGCKQLSVRGEDHIRIPDIITTLTHACKKSLEQENSGGLAVILTFAQFAFEHMHVSVGYNYANWFQDTFIHSGTTILNKKMGMVFINELERLSQYELPSILQIHGKALHYCTNIANASIYVSTVKKRLLELGVDSTFRNYPQSMKTPIQSVVVALEDEVSDIIHQFVRRDEIVPHSLLSAAVFRRAWFISTFLPKLFSWQGKEISARDKLIEALRKDKKIPEAMYSDFIQKK
ncbi:hypothetical protein INT47_000296 [Mucor saturninus]|uniref:Fanconi anaemia group A protein helical domain-containing protein n=1 Tax=Mucor saturninus TaxID=64648 RepID=A0A8H7V1W8_9FUNG|nr:hypothetical protein INT47_000296 [Mucor saturninus]